MTVQSMRLFFQRRVQFLGLVACIALSGGCDSQSTGSSHTDMPRLEASRGLIGAYYYPWYFKDRWTEQAVTHTPLLGHYYSADKATVRQHIQWAQQAGMDFFIVSWLSREGQEGRNLKNAFLPEIAKSNLRFAILYETPLALQTPGGKKIDLKRMLPSATTAGHTMIEHFDHLSSAYFNQPNYLRVDGRPVVIMYVVRDLTNAAPYFELLRERMKKKGFNPYLIADVLYWDSPLSFDQTLLKAHFDGLTAYNMYALAESSRSNFLALVEQQFRQSDIWARSIGLRLVPNVMPGYDDTSLRGKGRPVLGRDGGVYYSNNWRIASQFVDSQQPMLFVTSFNEWHEGTEIEPSLEHGNAYLRLSRELGDSLRAQIAGATNETPSIHPSSKTNSP